ncbi:UPF0481 protein At3g47200-like [Cornus florida]|uniref:UPF0481 protein At3g47200-like n=1 Tax=Cornus florida TaxID=4283 RepID=UPI00289C5B36|nr:UPF0481 protein At3g47200-like [Cornus florida]
MVEVVSDARSCYLEGSTDAYDDVAFARMMLLDGCFVLHFIYTVTAVGEVTFLEELLKFVGRADYRGIVTDIILLENQLPFLVLQALISCTGISAEVKWDELIENSIVQYYIDVHTMWTKQTYKHEVEQPLHLLDLMRRRFLGKYSSTKKAAVRSSDKVHQDGQPQPYSSCPPKREHRESNPVKEGYRHSFRSATELKARGIYFRPSTSFLNDFTFTSRFGYRLLRIPHISLGYRIKYRLLNMMAYELAPHTVGNVGVCSYVYFMNSLINGAEDVIELGTNNVIHNFYGTDEEVARTFNSMAAGGAYVSLSGPIKDVSDRIQEHYNSKMKTWTTQLF